MKYFKFLALCLIAALAVSIHTAAGQVTNATVQTGSVRVAPSRAAPVARPVANTAIARHVAPRPSGFTPRTFNTNAPRTGGQSPNLLPNYPVVARSLNPAVATINAQRIRRNTEREAIRVNPATRQTELRTVAAMRERRDFRNKNATLATLNSQRRVATQRRNLSQRRAKHQKTGREQIGATKMVIRTFWMRSIVIGTNGMIATGGIIIATRSYSLPTHTISWTEATGIRPLVTIRSTAITITTGQSTPTVICSPTK